MNKGMFVDENMSNLTSSASNEASFSSSSRNETGTIMYQQQSFASTPQAQPPKKKRNLPGNPDPEAEVIALSPRALMATNRFLCEICNKGFQRDQNLQLHRRGHNLPWKLKQRSNKEVIRKKVYVCPEVTCVHHEPSRALGDLTGIKKHFCRKHGEKKWKCEKCSKRYAVQSDWKAHSKICGTREYRCDCGTLFSRRDSFITHRAFCDALAEESARSSAPNHNISLSSLQQGASSSSILPPHLINLHQTLNIHNPNIPLQQLPFQLKREFQDQTNNNNNNNNNNNFNLINIRPENNNLPPWLESGHELSSQLFSSHANPSPNPNPTFPSSSPHLSATALLQKAAQMGVTSSAGHGFANVTSGGCMGQVNGTGGAPPDSLLQDLMTSAQGFEGSTSFEEAFDGMLNQKQENIFHLNDQKGNKEGGVNEGMTRDFLGLRAFPQHRDHFLNMAGFDHMSNNSSFHHQNQNQNQNQTPWQG